MFSWFWSTFNNTNFGKTWSFFRINMIDVFFILKGICYQKAKKAPTLLLFQGENLLQNYILKYDRIPCDPKLHYVVQSTWEGMIFCCGADHCNSSLQTFHFSFPLRSPRLISLIASGTFQQDHPCSFIIKKTKQKTKNKNKNKKQQPTTTNKQTNKTKQSKSKTKQKN